MNIAAADALMGIFGMRRVSPTDSELESREQTKRSRTTVNGREPAHEGLTHGQTEGNEPQK